MKTLKQLIKDFLIKQQVPEDIPEGISESDKVLNQENSDTLNLNIVENETETDENPGVHPVDTSSAPETDESHLSMEQSRQPGNPGKSRQSGEPAPDAQPGLSDKSGESIEAGNNPEFAASSEEETPNESKTPAESDDLIKTMKEKIEEAFQRGVIEGRNQQIETIFMEDDNDCIPRFRGSSQPFSPASDIFSLAREA